MLIKKIIGLVIIILIVTVQSSAAVNNDTDMNTTATNENLTDENPTNLDTTYEYKKIGINPIKLNLDRIDDNWMGKFMWTDEFITKNLGKFSPPSVRTRKWYNFFGWLYDCIRYGFYCIAYALGCVIMTLGWFIYSLAWVLVTAVWSVYATIMIIVNEDKITEFVDKLEKGVFNTENRNVTVIDPEKVMGESKSRALNKLSNFNYSPVDFEFSNIENDTDFNPKDPGILEYSVLRDGRHLITKQNDNTPDNHNNIGCSNYTYEDCSYNVNSTNLDKSNYCKDSINLNNCNNSILLVNSKNSINCNNSTFLENCVNVTSSSICNGSQTSYDLSNCIDCIECSELSSCFNCKWSENCSNSTNVFGMDNRHDENRRGDGFLVVLSTENVLDVNGNPHQEKTFFQNDSIWHMPKSPLYTMSESMLQEFSKNKTEMYNSFKRDNEEFKTGTIVMEVIGGILGGASFIVDLFVTVSSASGNTAGEGAGVAAKTALTGAQIGAKIFEGFAGAAEIAAHVMTSIYFAKESKEGDYDDDCKEAQSEINFRINYKVLVKNVN